MKACVSAHILHSAAELSRRGQTGAP